MAHHIHTNTHTHRQIPFSHFILFGLFSIHTKDTNLYLAHQTHEYWFTQTHAHTHRHRYHFNILHFLAQLAYMPMTNFIFGTPQTYTCTDTQTYAHTSLDTHTCTETLIHRYSYMNACTHTQTHTYTHRCACGKLLLQIYL